ncbi:hypothetical protein HYU19_02145 [Candidatus Woesearchaeota archaeon]|nr:hypothetical protein [Candidatus Woesearchaeota archaeon]
MRKEKDPDIEDVEDDLFSDIKINKTPDPNREVGLLSRKRNDDQEEPHTRHDDAAEEEPRQITLRIAPHTIERTVFVCVILVLLALVAYNPFYAYFPWNQGNQITGAAIGTGGKDAAAQAAPENGASEKKVASAGKNNTADQEVQEGENKDNAPGANALDNDSGTDQNTNTDASAGRTITLDDYQYAKKEWGVKMVSISVTIENQGEPFKPKIRATVFDVDTRSTYEQTPAIKVYDVLGKGKRLKATIDLGKFSFNDVAKPKTIKIKLLDEGDETGYANDKTLQVIEKTFTVK